MARRWQLSRARRVGWLGARAAVPWADSVGRLLRAGTGEQIARAAFVRSRLHTHELIHDTDAAKVAAAMSVAGASAMMGFGGFLEALCRLAHSKPLPSGEQLGENPNVSTSSMASASSHALKVSSAAVMAFYSRPKHQVQADLRRSAAQQAAADSIAAEEVLAGGGGALGKAHTNAYHGQQVKDESDEKMRQLQGPALAHRLAVFMLLLEHQQGCYDAGEPWNALDLT